MWRSLRREVGKPYSRRPQFKCLRPSPCWMGNGAGRLRGSPVRNPEALATAIQRHNDSSRRSAPLRVLKSTVPLSRPLALAA